MQKGFIVGCLLGTAALGCSAADLTPEEQGLLEESSAVEELGEAQQALVQDPGCRTATPDAVRGPGPGQPTTSWFNPAVVSSSSYRSGECANAFIVAAAAPYRLVPHARTFVGAAYAGTTPTSQGLCELTYLNARFMFDGTYGGALYYKRGVWKQPSPNAPFACEVPEVMAFVGSNVSPVNRQGPRVRVIAHAGVAPPPGVPGGNHVPVKVFERHTPQ